MKAAIHSVTPASETLKPPLQTLPSADVLGYKVARCTLEEAASWGLEVAFTAHPSRPQLLVTLNPEIIVQAEASPPLREALQHADLSVADGVGITWAARRCGVTLPGRVPGVDLMLRLLERGGPELRVYFLGAKPGVAERAAKTAQARFGTLIAGVQHGYFRRPGEVESVTQAVRESCAQLLLAGLGEGQELFLHVHRHALGAPLMMGVGGALDVLAGEAKRTPAWTQQAGLEWAWRISADPKRWHRLPRLLRFVQLVRRA